MGSSEFHCNSVSSVNSVAKDIHIIIGTKAQFIKMAPVMKGLDTRGVPYNFVNLGQHAATVQKLAEQFEIQQDLPQPLCGDVLGEGQRDIVSLTAMARWIAYLIFVLIFKRSYLKKEVFKGWSGIALIHGDTLSTLIGLLMAKRSRLKVAHIESGLRSWNYLHPFPEELIRVICMRYSDYCFAPSNEAVDNLRKMGVKGEIFNICGNTGMDAVKMALQGSDGKVNPPQSPLNLRGEAKERYVLVSIHRFENLYSRKRFQFILDTIDEVSKRFNVIFVMHGPTEKRLNKSGVRSQESGVITYLPLQNYPAFLNLIKDSEFVITDGGSVQEECSCLGKPCLIMRKRTERGEGVGENAVLSGFDEGAIGEFADNYKKYEKPEVSPKVRPTEVLIDELLVLSNSVSSEFYVAKK